MSGDARLEARVAGCHGRGDQNSRRFDVTTLRGRRADQRWNRTAVGDLLERLTWSRPDQDAIVGGKILKYKLRARFGAAASAPS
jgi:hypothetical protein